MQTTVPLFIVASPKILIFRPPETQRPMSYIKDCWDRCEQTKQSLHTNMNFGNILHKQDKDSMHNLKKFSKQGLFLQLKFACKSEIGQIHICINHYLEGCRRTYTCKSKMSDAAKVRVDQKIIQWVAVKSKMSSDGHW